MRRSGLQRRGSSFSKSQADGSRAAYRLDDAARTLAAPGSTLKPLVLYGLVSAGRWNPASRIACDRQLVVAGHRLACTHPPAPPFDAREALTWSCNSYFAAVARTLRPGELGRLLHPTGLLGATGLAREEAVAEFREPDSQEAEQLALLGVEGVRVTPLELAAAYRWLALELAAHPDSAATQVVRDGTGGFGQLRHGRAGKPGWRCGPGQDGNGRGHCVEPNPWLVCGPRARARSPKW